MSLETETTNKNKTKEFESLLNEDFKKRDFREGKIIKAIVSEIGKKYVFVDYLGNQGTISQKSIGGENTNLLPDGAKVINIDTNSLELIINYDDENFIFEL